MHRGDGISTRGGDLELAGTRRLVEGSHQRGCVELQRMVSRAGALMADWTNRWIHGHGDEWRSCCCCYGDDDQTMAQSEGNVDELGWSLPTAAVLG